MVMNMKLKIRITLLGVYDLVLSFGAIIIGAMMISSSNEIFMEYPKEWLSKVPFENWVVPGIIAIIIFGLGNTIAAILCFRKESNKSWIVSSVMGGILSISLVAQVIILGEWYLATVQFFALSIIQLSLSGTVFSGDRRSK
ncbi:MAG: hypothetical protein WBI07_20795 [Mobilitalea sp.]